MATNTFDYPHHQAASSVLAAHMTVGVEHSGKLLGESDVQGIRFAQTIGMQPGMSRRPPHAHDQDQPI